MSHTSNDGTHVLAALRYQRGKLEVLEQRRLPFEKEYIPVFFVLKFNSFVFHQKFLMNFLSHSFFFLLRSWVLLMHGVSSTK
jgi:hypothetical protein